MITEYEFELPKGYQDEEGNIHKKGKMRLATAGDEIAAVKDPRVVANPAYLSILILSKVITELEGVGAVSPGMIEHLFTADIAFLQDMYERINGTEPMYMKVICPHCGKEHEVQMNFMEER